MIKKIGALSIVFAVVCTFYAVYLQATTDFVSIFSGQAGKKATLFWFLGLLSTGFAIFSYQRPPLPPHPSDNLSPIERYLFLALLLFALAIRLFKLTHLGLFMDDVLWLSDAERILEGTTTSPFGYTGDQPSNLPAYFVAPFYFLTNASPYSARLTGIFFSICTIILIFAFLREAVNKPTAFISLILLSASIWDIYNSKIPWLNTTINPFVIVGALFFLHRGITRRSWMAMFWSGVFLGVGINLLYLALFTLVPVSIFLLHHLIIQSHKREILALSLVLVISTLITAAPTIPKVIRWQSRTLPGHLILLKELAGKTETGEVTSLLLAQARRTVQDFHYSPDKFRLRNYPCWGLTLDPFVEITMVAGILYFILNFYKPFYLLILMDFMVMFVPFVVIARRTSEWREYGLFPMIYILSSVGTYLIISAIQRLFFPNNQRRLTLILSVVMAAYLGMWIGIFKMFYENTLKEDSTLVETQCKKTADYILAHISRDTVIVLPPDYCTGMVTPFIKRKYEQASYDSFDELAIRIRDNKRVAIIKFPPAWGSSRFQMETPKEEIDTFLRREGLKPTEIYGNNKQEYATIYNN